MISAQKERNILLLSFISGVIFAVVELLFSIFSNSKSVFVDGIYDATELILIALTLFLTPIFRKPISEKYPYGFYQVESIFLIIKGFMMLSVSLGVGIDVIQSIVDGGHIVNGIHVSIFQIILGIISFFIYLTMKRWNKKASSPTVDAEIIGWKLDFSYSFGLAIAFFLSIFISKTPLAPLAPYFDPIIAIIVMLIMLPETISVLWNALKDVFLFSPDKNLAKEIKEKCSEILNREDVGIKYADIIRTGRHTWVSLYYYIDEPNIAIDKINRLTNLCTQEVNKIADNSTVELILAPRKE